MSCDMVEKEVQLSDGKTICFEAKGRYSTGLDRGVVLLSPCEAPDLF